MENTDLSDLPHEEQLVRLYEMSARFGVHFMNALGGPCTPSEQHRKEFGHPLRFGCCGGLGRAEDLEARAA